MFAKCVRQVYIYSVPMVLIAQAVFFLERGQPDTRTNKQTQLITTPRLPPARVIKGQVVIVGIAALRCCAAPQHSAVHRIGYE